MSDGVDLHIDDPKDRSAAPVIDRTLNDMAPLESPRLGEWPSLSEQLFSSLSEGIVVVDSSCRVLYANPAAERLFGMALTDLRGKCCDDEAWDICSPDGEKMLKKDLACSRVLGSGASVPSVEQAIRRPDGTCIDVIVSASPLSDDDGRVIGVVNSYTNVAELKAARSLVEESQENTRSIIRMCESLGRARDYGGILEAAAPEIQRVTGFSNIWIGILSEDRSHAPILDLKGGAFVEKARQLMQVDERHMTLIGDERFLTVPVEGDSLMEEILEANHTVVVENALTDPRTNKDIVAFMENRTIINVPLSLAGPPVGVLGLGTFGDEGFRPPTQRQLDYLSECAIHMAVAVDRVGFMAEQRKAEQDLASMVEHLEGLTEGIVKTLSNTTSQCDPYTALHQERVSRLAVAIAEELGWSDFDIEGLRTAALLHDIGKIAVPPSILAKPGALSDMEMGIIRSHTTIGYGLLEHVDFRHPIAETVLQHHERLDGSGYPNGLHGDGISMEARILAVADVVEAMASHRPYRPALGIEAALDEIRRNAGSKYDPAIVDVCVRVLEQQDDLI